MIIDKIRDRLIRARVQLQEKNPFFSYLVLNLKMVEDERVGTIGIDAMDNLTYNPKWIKPLTDSQIEMLLCHEVLHIAFHHLIREKKREHELWNIAIDLNVNDILVSNNFEMVEGGVIPQNHSFTFPDMKKQITIDDINKKSSEAIYDELYSKLPKDKKTKAKGFDKHNFSDGKGKTKAESKAIKESKEKWKKLLVEASTFSKQRGNLPKGVELHIGELLNEKVNWKYLLYKYITNELPIDYSYSNPSKRSLASGFYMPKMRRENIEIMVAVDTSGSIGQKELTEFMSEVVYIAKSFQNVKMKVIVCDCEVQEVLEVENGNIQTLLDMKIQGGGGTSHIPVYKKIEEEYPTTKFVINFTDGYTEFPTEETLRTIWVIPKGNNIDVPFGEVINI